MPCMHDRIATAATKELHVQRQAATASDKLHTLNIGSATTTITQHKRMCHVGIPVE
jgi:hypothetical protein